MSDEKPKKVHGGVPKTEEGRRLQSERMKQAWVNRKANGKGLANPEKFIRQAQEQQLIQAQPLATETPLPDFSNRKLMDIFSDEEKTDMFLEVLRRNYGLIHKSMKDCHITPKVYERITSTEYYKIRYDKLMSEIKDEVEKTIYQKIIMEKDRNFIFMFIKAGKLKDRGYDFSEKQNIQINNEVQFKFELDEFQETKVTDVTEKKSVEFKDVDESDIKDVDENSSNDLDSEFK